MRHRTFLPLLLGFVVLSTGCAATHREWEVWRAHPTHYATDNHLAFSMKNMVGAAPQVTPERRGPMSPGAGRGPGAGTECPARCGAGSRRRC